MLRLLAMTALLFLVQLLLIFLLFQLRVYFYAVLIVPFVITLATLFYWQMIFRELKVILSEEEFILRLPKSSSRHYWRDVDGVVVWNVSPGEIRRIVLKMKKAKALTLSSFEDVEHQE